MFSQLFFLAGLAAVAFFFLGVALLGMGLFTGNAQSSRRFAIAQTAVAWVLLGFTAACAMILRDRLAPWAEATPPDTASALVSATRETLSLMLLGLSCTVNVLLAAVAWVRLGRAGSAFRNLVWAFPTVKVVTSSAVALDFFGDLGGTTPAAESTVQIVHWGSLVAELSSGLMMAAGVAAALWVLSWPLGWLLGRSSRTAAGKATREA